MLSVFQYVIILHITCSFFTKTVYLPLRRFEACSLFEDVRSTTAATPLYDVPYRSTPTVDEWNAVTVNEIEKLISSAPCKTCQLDPAPTWLVKDILSPFVALLFNKSLSAGCFPATFKLAVIRLLLKKSGLDSSQMNYRPVSNLSFLSKLLERAVQTRLQAFIDSNNLMPTTQSAYRQGHSTETAVTKIYNDMLLAADSGQLTAVCLLDLTAAFDTVDHDLLLLRSPRSRAPVVSLLPFRQVFSCALQQSDTSLFTLCILCHKGRYWVRVFLFSTRRTLLTKWSKGFRFYSGQKLAFSID